MGGVILAAVQNLHDPVDTAPGASLSTPIISDTPLER